MTECLDTTIIPKALLALSVAFSGYAPAYAALPAPRAASVDDAALSSLLLRIQSVDPGDPDPPDPDPDPDPDTGGNDGGRDGGRDNNRNDRGGTDRYIQNERLDTRRIVEDLRLLRRECSTYDEVYRIDCLRQGLELVAAAMPDIAANREAKRILRRASRDLGRIVATYEDRSAPKLTAPRDANPRFRSRRSYRAVKRQSLPAANARARKVIEEAATQLLRSAENSERRYAHYQQISAAVDSTKTLLRSG